jgi:hypothetical protein
VSGLLETPEFARRDQGHVFVATPSDDDRFLTVFGHSQDLGEILSGVAV